MAKSKPQNSKLSGRKLLPDQVARALGLKANTLAIWRMQGKGPPFIKAGRQIFYDEEPLAAWLKQQEHHPGRPVGADACALRERRLRPADRIVDQWERAHTCVAPFLRLVPCALV